MIYSYRAIYSDKKVTVELFVKDIEKAYRTCMNNFGSKNFKQIYLHKKY